MRLKLLLFLLLLVPPSLPRDEHVLRLTDVNLPKLLTRHQNLVIMYFIPWSVLCRKFRPHYARAAKFMVENSLPVKVGKMDCSDLGKKTCEKQQVALHLPAIHFYKNGVLTRRYKSSRDTLSLIKFMRAQVVPAAVELKNIDEFKEFLKKQIDVVVVGFFEEDSKLKKLFMKIAEGWKEYIIFAFSRCEKLLMREGVLNGIVLFRPSNVFNRYEEERLLFSGREIIGDIRNFILRNYHGLIYHRTPTNRNNFVIPYIILYYTSDPHGDSNEVKYWRNRMMKTAHEYKDKIKMAVSAKEDFEEDLVDFKVDYNNKMRPFVIGIDLEVQKYVMSENFTRETFKTFVDDFVNNRLIPFTKSNITENDGAIIIATAHNFEDAVLKNHKDTFIDLYTHMNRSMTFTAVLKKVADLLQEEDIAIVKMDMVENAVPAVFAGRDIPGAYFLKRNYKTAPVWYPGEENIQDVIEFIAALASKEMVHYDKEGMPRVSKEEL